MPLCRQEAARRQALYRMCFVFGGGGFPWWLWIGGILWLDPRASSGTGEILCPGLELFFCRMGPGHSRVLRGLHRHPLLVHIVVFICSQNTHTHEIQTNLSKKF